MENQNRIELIDGFRGIAILSVLAFHYYSRFAPPVQELNLYPFDPPPIPILRYGYYGVNLFFVISGFVIFQSLSKSGQPSVFFRHRAIRLVPSMVLCSLLTYFIVSFVDAKGEYPLFHPSTLMNFLPSLTFTPFEFWNFLFGRQDIHYIDGAYWSLWAEVLFYLCAGTIYYARRKNFLSTWLMMALILQGIRIVTSPRLSELVPVGIGDFLSTVNNLFFVLNLEYWVYFSLGIFIFSLYSKLTISGRDWTIMTLLVVLEFYFLYYTWVRVLFVLMIGLFYMFLYQPDRIKILQSRGLVIIGLCSYPLYLLHEYVGVIFIGKVARVIGAPSVNILIPLAVAALMIYACQYIYINYEKPVMRYLRSKF